MPYKIRQEGSQYCVHKENADGSIGEKVACHASQSMAEDQMKALYAAEADKSVSIELEIEAGESDGKEKETEYPDGVMPNEMGYKQFAEFIESKWEDAYPDMEIYDIYDGYVICKMGEENLMVPYTVSEMEVSFDMENKTAVQMQTSWIVKSTKSTVVKSLGESRVGAYGIIWGDKTRRDSDDQYFTKNTAHLLDIFNAMGKIPYMVHHAADGVIKSTVLGEVDTMVIDDTGLWYEAKILQQELYKQYVSKLVDNGKMFSSSGALPAAVKATKSGEIISWPIAEMSCTWVPAEYRMMDGYSVEKLKAHYKAIGIDSTGLFDDEPSVEIDITDQQDAEEAAEIDIDQELRELAQNWLNLQKLQVEF